MLSVCLGKVAVEFVFVGQGLVVRDVVCELVEIRGLEALTGGFPFEVPLLSVFLAASVQQ